MSTEDVIKTLKDRQMMQEESIMNAGQLLIKSQFKTKKARREHLQMLEIEKMWRLGHDSIADIAWMLGYKKNFVQRIV